jgi:hypothetical protein
VTFPSALPKAFRIARGITVATAVALQLAGLYATTITFGVWITRGLYGVGGLAIVLQRIVLSRTLCLPGD